MTTVVDLFSGAGGMTLGLEQAGFSSLGGFDHWPEAVESYARNFVHGAHSMDLGAASAEDILKTVRMGRGEVDLVAGGPPCQGFSIQRIGADTDARNDLVVHFGKLVEGIAPRALLMENVPGLLGRRGRESMDRFAEVVSSAGYRHRIFRIDAVEYGVPQRRPRVLVYGWRSDLPDPRFELSGLPHRPVSVAEALSNLPKPPSAGAVEPADMLHVESCLSDLNRQRLRHIPPGGGFEDLPVELRVDCHREGAARIGHRAVYGRLHPDRPANVITARFDSFTRGRFAHPSQDRNITLREGARLQSFPDDFEFVGNREQIAAQIGNAVPPLVARGVGEMILRHLRGDQAELVEDMEC